MKHLYDSLRGCAKEEEVKAEFCKFFKMKIFALRGIDHYTEHVLFEFKYDRNFRNPENVALALAQGKRDAALRPGARRGACGGGLRVPRVPARAGQGRVEPPGAGGCPPQGAGASLSPEAHYSGLAQPIRAW